MWIDTSFLEIPSTRNVQFEFFISLAVLTFEKPLNFSVTNRHVGIPNFTRHIILYDIEGP